MWTMADFVLVKMAHIQSADLTETHGTGGGSAVGLLI